MRRGNLVRLLANVLACLALVVAGCGTDTASQTDQQLTTLRVAMFPGGSTLPAHAAIAKGIFERNGLRVELTEGTDLPVFMAALAKGQYDIVMSVPTLVMIGAEKGLDLQIISSLQRSSPQRPNAVWITKDPAIESLGATQGQDHRGALADRNNHRRDGVPVEPQRCGTQRRQIRSDTISDNGRSAGGGPRRRCRRDRSRSTTPSRLGGFGCTTTSLWMRCATRAQEPSRPR